MGYRGLVLHVSLLYMKRSLTFAFIVFTLCESLAQNGQAASPVTSIVFEEHGCFGTCPVFRVTLDSSGKGTYEGLKYTPRRVGRFDGSFSKGDFGRLTEILEKLDL